LRSKEGKPPQKDRALLLLKRKKYLEQQYEVADKELNHVKELVPTFTTLLLPNHVPIQLTYPVSQLSGIEFAVVQNEVLQSLERGNTALSRVQSQLSLDDAERIMDDNAEGIAYADELSDILSGSFTTEDNDDILSQLDALVGEIGGTAVVKPAVDSVLPDMPTVPVVLPEVPTHEPVVEEEPAREEAMAI